VVVWQRVIGMVCVLLAVLSAVLCGGVAACHSMVCVLLAVLSAVLCVGVAACVRYGVYCSLFANKIFLVMVVFKDRNM
jgi:hypothetical protein